MDNCIKYIDVGVLERYVVASHASCAMCFVHDGRKVITR